MAHKGRSLIRVLTDFDKADTLRRGRRVDGTRSNRQLTDGQGLATITPSQRREEEMHQCYRGRAFELPPGLRVDRGNPPSLGDPAATMPRLRRMHITLE